jgi:Leucine-rich repeat (LRR) protein
MFTTLYNNNILRIITSSCKNEYQTPKVQRPALKEMKVMAYLSLHNIKITDIGIEKLVPALKEMKGMTRLYLDRNKITDIDIEKLVPALKVMKGMTRLHFYH